MAQPTTKLSEVISTFRPAKLFRREDVREGQQPHVLSLDYDDTGDFLLTAESDETIQIYNVREGKHEKGLLSKKYGAKLARFTHKDTGIIYASTKQNDAIRYLATHDNSFIRYFEGHEGRVSCLTMHPGHDTFISCSQDNTVRLWSLSTRQWVGQIFLNSPYLAAYDPSGQVFAVASPTSGSVLVYDCRNFEQRPVSTFDVIAACKDVNRENLARGWTKLEFSNDGKFILLGTQGGGHFLLDSFDGSLRAYLRKPDGGTCRLAPGETTLPPLLQQQSRQRSSAPRNGHAQGNGGAQGNGSAQGSGNASTPLESSGDCCFTPDGRFILGGSQKNVLVWDTQSISTANRRGGSGGGGGGDTSADRYVYEPTYVLEDQREAAVLAFNPRYNCFASADQHVEFWVPELP